MHASNGFENVNMPYILDYFGVNPIAEAWRSIWPPENILVNSGGLWIFNLCAAETIAISMARWMIIDIK